MKTIKKKIYPDSCYEGEMEDNLKNGYGKSIFVNGDVYEGDYVNDYRHGKGKYRFFNGNLYEGDFANDLRNGHGKLTYRNGTYYEGQFSNDKFHGYGQMHYANGEIYDGEYINDYRHGEGKYYFKNGSIYEGSFFHNARTGKARFTFKNGDVYIGSFKDGKFDGYGEMYYSSGNTFKGEYENGLQCGHGIITWNDGEYFDGYFYKNKKHGLGTFHYADGSSLTIQYVDDKRQGKGIYTYYDGDQRDVYYHDNIYQTVFDGHGTNPLCIAKKKGFCKELKGNIVFNFIFVDDNQSKWTQQDIKNRTDDCFWLIDTLEENAKKENIFLKCLPIFEECWLDLSFQKKNSASYFQAIARQMGFESMQAYRKKLMVDFNTQSVIFYILSMNTGKSYATNIIDVNRSSIEMVHLFKQDRNTLLHETLHLFGASNLSHPSIVQNEAQKLFSDSIMFNRKNETIDSLTKYLIGWHDKPDAKALKLLNATKDYTYDEYKKDNKNKNILNSKHIKLSNYKYVYEGQLVNGMRHGYGRMEFRDGSIYEGKFEKDYFQGYGIYRFADGSIYDGFFKNGNMHGKGKLYYAKGSYYEGDFVDNMREGMGVYKGYDGTSYEGDFKKDKFDGL
ncbi:MAG: hypothetical protein HUJ53_04510, partial [Holdemanella sp.]|nr:hypothetical protein [Holdemanella sp.]